MSTLTKKIIFHIGHGKTGTSAVQRYLMQVSLVQNCNFLYPHTTRSQDGGHHSLFNCGPEVCEKLKAEINHTEKESVILSSESGLPNLRHFVEDSDFKHNFFAYIASQFETNVIYYVRNHFEIIESAFLQYIQTNDVPLYSALNEGNSALVSNAQNKLMQLYFSDNVDSTEWINTAPTRQFDYFANITRFWEPVFGSDSIITKVYSRETLVNNDIVEDFFDLLPSPIMSPAYPFRTSKLANATTVYQHFPRLFLLSDECKKRVNFTFRDTAQAYADKFLNKVDASLLLKGFW